MTNKNRGRPLKVNTHTMLKLQDAFHNGANVTRATKYAGISRETYYHYLRANEVFAEKMEAARRNRHLKVILGLF